MTRVQIFRHGGKVRSFSCIGHAGYAEAGADIVCAGVTAIVFNTVNCLTDLLGENLEVETDEEEGALVVNFRDDPSEKAEFLVDCMIHGLEWIEQQYGRKYLRYQVKEV